MKYGKYNIKNKNINKNLAINSSKWDNDKKIC